MEPFFDARDDDDMYLIAYGEVPLIATFFEHVAEVRDTPQ
jgi:hypothetical protein